MLTLASWSSRVPTMRSPGRQSRAIERVNANVIVVMFGPNHTLGVGAPKKRAATSHVDASSSSVAALAANEPPQFALSPLAAQPCMASIA